MQSVSLVRVEEEPHINYELRPASLDTQLSTENIINLQLKFLDSTLNKDNIKLFRTCSSDTDSSPKFVRILVTAGTKNF